MERDLLVRLDDLVMAVIHLVRNRTLTRIMIAITDLGSPFILVPGTVLLAAFLMFRRRIPDAVFVTAAMIMGGILNTIVKNAIQRARPFPPPGGPLVEAGGWSYPSGHALLSTLFYFTLAYIAGRLAGREYLRLPIAVAALLISGLISLSRVYLGVHYPSDILAGMTGGILLFAICLTAMHFYEVREKRR